MSMGIQIDSVDLKIIITLPRGNDLLGNNLLHNPLVRYQIDGPIQQQQDPLADLW